MNRFTQSTNIVPSQFQSGAYALLRNIQFPTPLHHCLGFALKSHQAIVTFVIGLFFLCAPFAILRRIVTIVINAVNRMIRAWSFAHVGKKVFKLQPTVTNSNTASSIVHPLTQSGVATSAPHPLPTAIFRCFRFPVLTKCITNGFSMPTPARNSTMFIQYRTFYSSIIAALTQAQPLRMPLLVFTPIAQDCQKPHLATFYVNKIMRGWFRKKFNFRNVNIENSHRSKDNSFVNLVRAVERFNLFQRPAFIIP